MELSTLVSPEILEKIKAGGYVVMFILMIIEWPLITLAGAALASMGFFNIFIVALLGWIGDMAGDFIFFSIGRYGIKNFTKNSKISEKNAKNFLCKLDTLVEKNLLLAIFLIKFIPYAPPIGFPYIGRSDIPFRKFIINSLVSCIPIPLFIAIIGFNIGKITTFWNTANNFEKILSILAIIFLVVFLIFSIKFFKKKITATLGGDENILCETKIEKIEKTASQSQKVK